MTKPTFDQVAGYIRQKGYHVSAETFIAYYDANGWMVGKSPMKDWQAALRYWESSRKEKSDLRPAHQFACTRCHFNPPSESPKSEFCTACLDDITAEARAMGVEVE